MKTRAELLQELVQKYQLAGHKLPASPRDIARWAIDNKLLAPRPEAILNQCADEIARAMAIEYFTDTQGRRVRAKHAVVYYEGPKQHALWDDLRTAVPKHMEVAFQQRRHHILGECKQLKNDVDSYNENRKPPTPIQMIFNFSLDLEEIELAKKRAA